MSCFQCNDLLGVLTSDAQVARRLAVDEELNKMRMLCAQTEHEWLAYRAEVEELRAGRQQVSLAQRTHGGVDSCVVFPCP